jgi:hypothetical protein
MKTRITLLAILFMAGAFQNINAQDTLVLVNGKQKTGVEFMKVQDDYVYYQIWKGDNPKIKLKSKDQVYAVYTKEGQHIITYKQDSVGFILDEKTMFDYIAGMANAWETYNNPYVMVIGFAAAGGSAIFVPTLVSFLVPVAYPGIIAMKTPNVANSKHIPDDKKNNYYYVLGYQDVARAKKIRSAVIGAGSGYLAGMMIQIFLIE